MLIPAVAEYKMITGVANSTSLPSVANNSNFSAAAHKQIQFVATLQSGSCRGGVPFDPVVAAYKSISFCGCITNIFLFVEGPLIDLFCGGFTT